MLLESLLSESIVVLLDDSDDGDCRKSKPRRSVSAGSGMSGIMIRKSAAYLSSQTTKMSDEPEPEPEQEKHITVDPQSVAPHRNSNSATRVPFKWEPEPGVPCPAHSAKISELPLLPWPRGTPTAPSRTSRNSASATSVSRSTDMSVRTRRSTEGADENEELYSVRTAVTPARQYSVELGGPASDTDEFRASDLQRLRIPAAANDDDLFDYDFAAADAAAAGNETEPPHVPSCIGMCGFLSFRRRRGPGKPPRPPDPPAPARRPSRGHGPEMRRRSSDVRSMQMFRCSDHFYEKEQHQEEEQFIMLDMPSELLRSRRSDDAAEHPFSPVASAFVFNNRGNVGVRR